MVNIPEEQEPDRKRFLRVAHTALLSEVSCLFSFDSQRNGFSLDTSISELEGISPDLKVLADSPILNYAALNRLAICPGHYLMSVTGKGRGRETWIPSSLLILPWPHPEEKSDILSFCRFSQDAYKDEDLHFIRNLLGHFEYSSGRMIRPGDLPITPGTGVVLEDLESNPYYLTNLLLNFVKAARRILPVESIILTLWSDIVPKGDFLQVAGYSEDTLRTSNWFERQKYLARHLGSSFRIDDFHFYFKKYKFRMEIDDILPTMSVSVSSPLRINGSVVGSITLKTQDDMAREQMKKALPDLVELLLWEMRRERTRTGITCRIRGGGTSLIKPRAFQDELIKHYRSARRYGDALSAIIFRPNNPYCSSGTCDESFSRLFLLMRKSIRAIDFACTMGLNGLLILLPRAGHRDALKVAERLMLLAEEVVKYDRFLSKKTAFEYRVVCFPESAKNEMELWEAISDAVPV